MNKALLSSNTPEWKTPRDLFEHLDKLYGFTLDAAATDENALCKTYFTKENDGLLQSWADHTVFVNPPYGRSYNERWSRKIAEEGKKTVVVALLPARTGSKWFQDNILTCSTLIFLKGRVKFVGAQSGAPFDSCIAEWVPYDTGPQVIRFCRWDEI